MNANLREQNTAIDEACAKLEAANSANASGSYTQRVIEALYENGDPVSVDAAEELRRLTAQLEAVTTGETLCRVTQPQADAEGMGV